MIAGVFAGLVGSSLGASSLPVLGVLATVVAGGVFAALFTDQERRWRRSDDSLQSHFLPDGTPSMSVTTIGDRTSPNRGRAAFPALAGADSDRTEAGKAAS